MPSEQPDDRDGAVPLRAHDELAAAAEPHCPTCRTVLHAHPRGWECRGCQIEWPAGLILPGE